MTVDARRSPGGPRLPALGQVCYWLLLSPRGRGGWPACASTSRHAPLAGLRRLLDASQAYDGFNYTVDALFGGDAATALASAGRRPDLTSR